jgi:hypothetical protein
MAGSGFPNRPAALPDGRTGARGRSPRRAQSPR